MRDMSSAFVFVSAVMFAAMPMSARMAVAETLCLGHLRCTLGVKVTAAVFLLFGAGETISFETLRAFAEVAAIKTFLRGAIVSHHVSITHVIPRTIRLMIVVAKGRA
jgi:hypothetical protein